MEGYKSRHCGMWMCIAALCVLSCAVSMAVRLACALYKITGALLKAICAIISALAPLFIFLRLGYFLSREHLLSLFFPAVRLRYDDIRALEVIGGGFIPRIKISTHSGGSFCIYPACADGFYSRLVARCRNLDAV